MKALTAKTPPERPEVRPPVERPGGDRPSERPRFIDRTLKNLRGAWNEIAERTVGVFSGTQPSPSLPNDDAARLRDQMRDCLASRGGEVSARARAASLGRAYLALNAEGRQRFLRILATDFDADRAAIDRAIDGLKKADGNDAARRKAERRLRAALEPPRVKLLTQFNGLPEGVKFLVDLRAELLTFAKGDAAMAALDEDLKQLLAAWFDVGFLELRRITWDSPAALLEKLIAYEAVHEIHGWNDLKNRLDSDRRCFAFFHPRMPDEPLIFVEVALHNGLAANIQRLLDPTAPVQDSQSADTAIFYSISNAQRGLVGISFGGFLIKRVVDVLALEFRNLKDFATLSPIPGFRHWLERELKSPTGELLLPAERKALAQLPIGIGDDGAFATLLGLPAWADNVPVARALRGPVTRLAARYLTEEKRDGGRALDPVAHFHLSNGARVEQLDWLADRSEKGLAQSYGLMVNYRYRQADIEANHEAYTGEGQVAAASAVRALLKG
ncbi:MAG TPA: malonyl-CoA decarboxylase [Alphaproteobacteria bacterium]|nr:malonyl-CoA decarboxylase [Alphaproteobacteria bacterium]